MELLAFWDTTGEWAKWGLFEANADDELVFKALGSAWIYIQNTEPEITAAQFGAILQNADKWNGFYVAIENLAKEILPKRQILLTDAGKLTSCMAFSDKYIQMLMPKLKKCGLK